MRPRQTSAQRIVAAWRGVDLTEADEARKDKARILRRVLTAVVKQCAQSRLTSRARRN